MTHIVTESCIKCKGVESALQDSIRQFEKLGMEIHEVSLPHTNYGLPVYYLLLFAEASANLARMDGTRFGLSVSDGAKDVIDIYLKTRHEGFGDEVKRRIMLGAYALSAGYYDAYYLKAQKVRTLLRRDFESAFASVDVLLAPTCPTTAFKLGEKTSDPLEMYLSDTYTVAINPAGVPALALPLIMHHLREKAPVARAELAEMTGLNKTTVSSLVRELIDRQFVREVGYEEPGSRQGAGRLAVLLTPDPAAGFIVSAELGVDFMLVTTANFAPEIIWRYKEAIAPDMGQHVILDRMLALLQQAIQEGCKTCNTLLGVAVGVPGLVDQVSGTLIYAPNLRWETVPLHALLSKFIQAPLVAS